MPKKTVWMSVGIGRKFWRVMGSSNSYSSTTSYPFSNCRGVKGRGYQWSPLPTASIMPVRLVWNPSWRVHGIAAAPFPGSACTTEYFMRNDALSRSRPNDHATGTRSDLGEFVHLPCVSLIARVIDAPNCFFYCISPKKRFATLCRPKAFPLFPVLSYCTLASFLLSRFGTSPKSESGVGLTQFISTRRITQCSSRRRMWPSQFDRLCLARKIVIMKLCHEVGSYALVGFASMLGTLDNPPKLNMHCRMSKSLLGAISECSHNPFRPNWGPLVVKRYSSTSVQCWGILWMKLMFWWCLWSQSPVIIALRMLQYSACSSRMWNGLKYIYNINCVTVWSP